MVEGTEIEVGDEACAVVVAEAGDRIRDYVMLKWMLEVVVNHSHTIETMEKYLCSLTVKTT